MQRGKSGFTLIELLVVVGIVLILIAIALPRYQTIRIRSHVVMAKSHVETLSRGLEVYAADANGFPPAIPRIPSDPLGLFSDHQLSVLTTPIGYVNRGAMEDPFGVVEAQFLDPSLSGENDFPVLTQPNSQQSLLYFHYPSLAARRLEALLGIEGASTISIGPDRIDSLGAYRPFDPVYFAAHLRTEKIRHPYDTVYQPTNGTRSPGDIGGYAGEAKRMRVP